MIRTRVSTTGTNSAGAPWLAAWLGAIVGIVLAFVFFAPASLMADSIQSLSGGQVLLSEPRGTLWNGSSRVIVTGGVGSRDVMALPGRIQWTVRPAFIGVRASVAADCCTTAPVVVDATANWGGADVAIGPSESRWPAALLNGLGTPWNTMELDGTLALSTRQFGLSWSHGRAASSGQLEIQANELSSSLSTLHPVGSYRVKIQGGPVTTLALDTLSGDLKLEGTGQLTPSGLRFNGTANATPEREGALANLLSIIGRRSGAASIITIG